MQSQDTNSIRLIPTKHSHVFNVALSLGFQTRYIGRLDQAGEGTFIANRTEKHLHRKSNSLGVNLELLERFTFRWIVIMYCGERLVTTKKYILEHGRIFSFDKSGYEKQCFLNLNDWSEENAIAYEEELCSQGELFCEPA